MKNKKIEIRAAILSCSNMILEEMKTLPCDEDGNEQFLKCQLAIEKLFETCNIVGRTL